MGGGAGFCSAAAWWVRCGACPLPGALVVRSGNATGPVLFRLCGNNPPLSTAPVPVPPGGLQLYVALSSPTLSSYQVVRCPSVHRVQAVSSMGRRYWPGWWNTQFAAGYEPLGIRAGFCMLRVAWRVVCGAGGRGAASRPAAASQLGVLP